MLHYAATRQKMASGPGVYLAGRAGTRLAVTVTSTSPPGGTSRNASARVRTGTLGCLPVPKYWL
ncbi:hypothetical protein [Cupriavidus basilensis]|uniref:hypothetical protein n=1 Tax=Cupriavidus basilensis TaxID=68895 RepID=UPI0020A67655|nr:hypothetical protein [Cupriavidus basilensis]MCP3024232.1 hypothetical protein [Cupriavidus basilensis]